MTARPRGPSGRCRRASRRSRRRCVRPPAAARFASATSGGSVGQFSGSVSSSACLIGGHSVTWPPASARAVSCTKPRPERQPCAELGGEHLVHGGQHVGQGAEAVCSGTGAMERSTARRAQPIALPTFEEVSADRRPGTNRSTASGRPPRTASAAAAPRCRRRRIRSTRASITPHCWGLVSWLSSTRMWVMPVSSL